MNDEIQPRSWFATIPGILTALAAVLTAVTGLILALRGRSSDNSDHGTSTTTVVVRPKPPVTPSPGPPPAPPRATDTAHRFVIVPPPPGVLDRCLTLNGNALQVSANKNQAHGTVGPIRLTREADGAFHFQTRAQFVNEPSDAVSGSCKNSVLRFERTRPGVFVQIYSGTIAFNGAMVGGLFSHNSPTPTVDWSAQIIKIVK